MAHPPLLLLEHVNLNVSDPDLARKFYVEGLGGKLNLVGTNDRQVHINLGFSQFHLPFKLSVKNREPVQSSQIWAGHLELTTCEELSELSKRLQENFAASSCSNVSVEEEYDDELTSWSSQSRKDTESSRLKALHVQCPYGNKFIVSKASEESLGARDLSRLASGSDRLISMPSAIHMCKYGSAKHIASFYTQILRCSVTLEEADAQRQSGARCVVHFGGLPPNYPQCAEQSLIYYEQEEAPESITKAYDTSEVSKYHICVYMSSQDAYQAAFRRAQTAGLLYINERFQGGPPEFASSDTWKVAESCGQFRVKDLSCPVTGTASIFVTIMASKWDPM
ncbi:hypothetical protein CYMTET_21300 [Cymbomonas tetramitiformis]|uniref:VOC domain-containing protein n=1 Tax=Cymbomonas tetramitiformis TaxID=36881 RepID=A0AAE0G2G4_9CHLO|nr:hypothetical protein CYMTET_21300 [Cymbomonas tetramitiformis]